MKIGWIGVGRMGAPMAANLIKGGHEVYLYDVRTLPADLIPDRCARGSA